ncbi:MAG TPA: efflux RND transporter periplasmic adaptor subunit [Burkholderiaceae bacterium]|nr:efflux RND transporter periplasmic adaptor subunit [Burkholderiaceae bacterium]
MQVSSLWRPRVLAVLVLIAAGAAGWWWWNSASGADAPKFRTAKLEKGPITASVSSSGTVNPVTSVQVGSQVSGQIKELFADFNSLVKQGQLIARIDPETFQYRVRQAEADLEAARSNEGRGKVALANAQRELARTRELVAKNFVSGAELDAKQAGYDLAAAELRNAQAVVKQREAQLASSRVDLGRTEIRAPVDGVVIKRSVDVGQTVAASLQAPELFLIAKDLRDMQVETSIDEADVGRVRPGQRATFTVDAYPGRQFSGEIKQVRKAATNTQNVITYTALVSAANPDGALMPGMTANVRIVTDTRESVLKAPNAALRFRPPGEGAADAKGAPGKADAKGGEAAGAAKAAAAAPGAGGQAGQLRERLVGELKLDEAQQARLDPILADTRAKFAAARDLPEEARGKAMAAARAESRARIEEILRPEQKERYAQITAEMAGRSAQATRGRVWVLDADGKPRAVEVRAGLSDGTATEVSGEGLAEGTEVLTGVQGPAPGASAPKAGGPPRMMF